MDAENLEKRPVGQDVEGEVSDSFDQDAVQWSEGEEKKLLRKVDILIMPLLILGFFALQLDRGNIGNALTDGLLADIGVTQNEFNLGQQLLFLGIMVLEIPSNLILYRIGPVIWIGGQIVAWGFVATFQAFQKGLGPFYATRLLLGLCEAGFIPGSLFILSRWYKRGEISRRFSWFFIGNLFAASMSGIIAFGILHMRGVAGLSGWQWLFLLEGIFTILVGLAFLATFPQSTANPVSLLRIRYFNERETQILVQRVLRDDPSKAQVQRNVTWAEMKSVFTNWRLIPHLGFTIVGIAPASAFGSYAPSLVASFGFDKLRANAMTSAGFWGLFAMNILWGFMADKFGVRGPLVMLGFALGLVFNIANRALIDSNNPNLRFAIFTLSIAFAWPWHAVNGSWLSLNAKSPGERSITMALHIMAANCGGLVGKQFFRSEDAPRYYKGFSVIAGVTGAGLVLATLATLQYYFLNGRVLRRKGLRYMY